VLAGDVHIPGDNQRDHVIGKLMKISEHGFVTFCDPDGDDHELNLNWKRLRSMAMLENQTNLNEPCQKTKTPAVHYISMNNSLKLKHSTTCSQTTLQLILCSFFHTNSQPSSSTLSSRHDFPMKPPPSNIPCISLSLT
jgi:hypothetical protein